MRKLFIIICLLSFGKSIIGQSVKGKIVDSQNSPLIGVNVTNLGNEQYTHTHTDDNGNFNLDNVTLGDTLYFTYIGFQSRKIVVQDYEERLDIKLSPVIFSLKEVVISPRIDALNAVTDIDIKTSPVNSSQDVLKKVPGLFIGQHAGGGKAEQIFLRGFDIDHGTDINITVDGLPVNMVSHAHGQGYADLHFLIPETIEKIDFGKGPYYADQGNFNTAGYVNFQTKNKLENSLIKLEAGQFNTRRILTSLKILDQQDHNSYFSAEHIVTDGPFESPQNFERTNLFAKYTGKVSPNDKLGLTASYFTSTWDASGQIPVRSVEDGSITRFGAIDDTEGGTTNRLNLLLSYQKTLDNQSFIKNSLYFINYNFELYSNFTFFLEDPVNGDQIRQRENRNIFGYSSEYNRSFSNGDFDGLFQVGLNLRKDFSKNNELSRTANRVNTLSNVQFGDIDESNYSAYAAVTLDIGKWTINPALRLDFFDFQYKDDLILAYTVQSDQEAMFSPKINVLYNYSKNLQFYLKSGKGFHSNDTRVVVQREGREILPEALGGDVGLIWKPFSNMYLNLGAWYLFLEQEFVYVGDAGIVEPSGRTRRSGIDFTARYQPLDWLFFNLDANYTYARSIDEDIDENYIPLAPDLTLVSSLNFIHPSGFNGGLNLRYLDNRPANEDNSIVAEGYTVLDFNVGYSWKRYGLGIQIQNLTDTDWIEAQFATESRLLNERLPVEEIHFTPGNPFFIKGIFSYKF